MKSPNIRVEEIALWGVGKVGEIANSGQIKNKKKSARTTRFFFSPSISNNSPGMGNELSRFGEQDRWEV